MKWPFVSRARFELLEHNMAVLAAELRAQIRASENYGLHWANRAEAAETRYADLLEKYHALRITGANAPEPIAPTVAFPEPDVPPDEVLAAIQSISPVRDKTYEANWAHWEKNKEKAANHPAAFAEEILTGVVGDIDWTLQTR